MFILRITIPFLLLFSATASAEKPVTVVELYTSQGCYSCPPADKLLGKLKQEENMIAFSCHVTYWNYLGWRDTFSRDFCDTRQRNYQRHLKGYQGVYTPQMIFNGRYASVGSRASKVQRIINYTNENDTVSPIDFTIDNKQLRIQPLQTSETELQLYLLGISGDHLLPISKGENAGKRLPYHNPVEYSVSLGQWNPKEGKTHAIITTNSAIKEWIVIAQEIPLGKIIAAGKIKQAL